MVKESQANKSYPWYRRLGGTFMANTSGSPAICQMFGESFASRLIELLGIKN